eukprot:TRINITY_DN541_c0_g2_i6.p1 TRINITY_DN541_c0_g2~~TRINITY_DN541_c0_g2_i6.p1  ORF type:complete len:101 (-),score=0.46 TRINITY_DN541_c0_g2_i6:210-512(-)
MNKKLVAYSEINEEVMRIFGDNLSPFFGKFREKIHHQVFQIQRLPFLVVSFFYQSQLLVSTITASFVNCSSVKQSVSIKFPLVSPISTNKFVLFILTLPL